MSNNSSITFEDFLNKFSEGEWFEAVEAIAPRIHEVDRNATRIWFRFFPLGLHRYLQAAEDKEEAIRRFVLQGKYELKDQIDTSHHFLYGHRYWKTVKAEIEAEGESFAGGDGSLETLVSRIAERSAEKAKADVSLVLGITAVGLMTVVQAGLQAVRSSAGETKKPRGIMAKSPKDIVRERAKDDSQGLLGFLKTVDKSFSVHYMSQNAAGSFKIINDEEISSASAKDQSRDWQAQDPRCWEGVVPVECKSAACGTCWVGVLGGEEKLSEVARLERRQTRIFGYNQPEEEKPYLRLACQARAFGNVSIVIPPWNGIFGRDVYEVEFVELEPATTSAKKNRTVVKDAVKNQLM